MVEKIKQWLYGIKADKLLHIIAGMVIAQVAYRLLSLVVPMWWAMLAAFGVAVIAGAVKEAIDVKYGVPSWKDFIATVIGGVVGLLIMMI